MSTRSLSSRGSVREIFSEDDLGKSLVAPTEQNRNNESLDGPRSARERRGSRRETLKDKKRRPSRDGRAKGRDSRVGAEGTGNDDDIAQLSRRPAPKLRSAKDRASILFASAAGELLPGTQQDQEDSTAADIRELLGDMHEEHEDDDDDDHPSPQSRQPRPSKEGEAVATGAEGVSGGPVSLPPQLQRTQTDHTHASSKSGKTEGSMQSHGGAVGIKLPTNARSSSEMEAAESAHSWHSADSYDDQLAEEAERELASSHMNAHKMRRPRGVVERSVLRCTEPCCYFCCCAWSSRSCVARSIITPASIGSVDTFPTDATCVLNPKSQAMRRWDLVMVVLLVFVAIVTPFEVAFLASDSLDLTVANGDTTLFLVNRLVDLAFLVDICFQFFLAYQEDSGRWVTFHDRIAARYLSSWFWIDLCSILPFDSMSLLLADESANLLARLSFIRVIRLLRLAKLFRIVRAGRIFSRWREHLSLPHAWTQLASYAVVVVLAAHWTACLWRLVVDIEGGGTGPNASRAVTPAARLLLERNEPSWITEYENQDSFEAGDLYVTAVYFALATITTVGFGDVVPVTLGERVAAIVSILVGASVWALVVGSVTSLLSSLSPATSRFYQNLDAITTFAADNTLPNDLVVRLRRFFHYSRPLHRMRWHRHLYDEMSPALRREVAVHINRVWVERVPFFRFSSVASSTSSRAFHSVVPRAQRDEFITEVALAMEPLAFAPGENVIQVGETALKLFVIQRGVMSRLGRVLFAGTVVGEDVILPLSKRTYSVHALTYTTVSAVARQDLESILGSGRFPSVAAAMRRFAVRASLLREVLHYARLIRIMRQIDRGFVISSSRALRLLDVTIGIRYPALRHLMGLGSDTNNNNNNSPAFTSDHNHQHTSGPHSVRDSSSGGPGSVVGGNTTIGAASTRTKGTSKRSSRVQMASAVDIVWKAQRRASLEAFLAAEAIGLGTSLPKEDDLFQNLSDEDYVDPDLDTYNDDHNQNLEERKDGSFHHHQTDTEADWDKASRNLSEVAGIVSKEEHPDYASTIHETDAEHKHGSEPEADHSDTPPSAGAQIQLRRLTSPPLHPDSHKARHDHKPHRKYKIMPYDGSEPKTGAILDDGGELQTDNVAANPSNNTSHPKTSTFQPPNLSAMRSQSSRGLHLTSSGSANNGRSFLGRNAPPLGRSSSSKTLQFSSSTKQLPQDGGASSPTKSPPPPPPSKSSTENRKRSPPPPPPRLHRIDTATSPGEASRRATLSVARERPPVQSAGAGIYSGGGLGGGPRRQSELARPGSMKKAPSFTVPAPETTKPHSRTFRLFSPAAGPAAPSSPLRHLPTRGEQLLAAGMSPRKVKRTLVEEQLSQAKRRWLDALLGAANAGRMGAEENQMLPRPVLVRLAKIIGAAADDLGVPVGGLVTRVMGRKVGLNGPKSGYESHSDSDSTSSDDDHYHNHNHNHNQNNDEDTLSSTSDLSADVTKIDASSLHIRPVDTAQPGQMGASSSTPNSVKQSEAHKQKAHHHHHHTKSPGRSKARGRRTSLVPPPEKTSEDVKDIALFGTADHVRVSSSQEANAMMRKGTVHHRIRREGAGDTPPSSRRKMRQDQSSPTLLPKAPSAQDMAAWAAEVWKQAGLDSPALEAIQAHKDRSHSEVAEDRQPTSGRTNRSSSTNPPDGTPPLVKRKSFASYAMPWEAAPSKSHEKHHHHSSSGAHRSAPPSSLSFKQGPNGQIFIPVPYPVRVKMSSSHSGPTIDEAALNRIETIARAARRAAENAEAAAQNAARQAKRMAGDTSISGSSPIPIPDPENPPPQPLGLSLPVLIAFALLLLINTVLLFVILFR